MLLQDQQIVGRRGFYQVQQIATWEQRGHEGKRFGIVTLLGGNVIRVVSKCNGPWEPM